MEAAAHQVQSLSRNILPDRPHHLSYSADRRYRPPPDEKRFEEDYYPSLQYMTLVSDADRGVLLTIGYDAMREEPPPPTSSKLANLDPARGDKKPSTKISLSDYKNKQKKPSQSPPARARDSIRMEENTKGLLDGRSVDAARKKEKGLSNGDVPAKADRGGPSRGLPRDDRLPPKPPPPAIDRVRSPERRKRHADDDDAVRPPKRSRAEINGTTPDRTRTPRDDGSRRRDDSRSDDRSPRKDKVSTISSVPNGRIIRKPPATLDQTTSPSSRPQPEPRISNRQGSPIGSTKQKTSSSSKSYVPPLLSPLVLSFDDSEPPSRTKKKTSINNNISPETLHKPAKSKTVEPQPPEKKSRRAPLQIPPLLSPTLPPMIEEKLAQLSKIASTVEGCPAPDPALSTESQNGSKKPTTNRDGSGKIEKRGKRLIVKLKITKRAAKTVQRILALQPRKDVLSREKSASVEESASQPQSKKRPLGGEAETATTTKRPRTSDVVQSLQRAPPPSTPPKHKVVLPSLASSNSTVDNFPEARASQSPQPPPSANSSLAQNGHDIEAARPRLRLLYQHSQKFNALGASLKHARDDIIRSSAPDAPPVSGVNQMRAALLGIEAILSYMVAYKVNDESRIIEHRNLDPRHSWHTLQFLLEEVTKYARPFRVLHVVALHIQGVFNDEFILACSRAGDHGPSTSQLFKQIQARKAAWVAAHRATQGLKPGDIPSIGPWSDAFDAARIALEVMAKWGLRKGVGWKPEVVIPEDL